MELRADVAAILSVESKDEGGKSRDARLTIVKNRHGRRGTVHFLYKLAFDTFADTASQFIGYVDTRES